MSDFQRRSRENLVRDLSELERAAYERGRLAGRREIIEIVSRELDLSPSTRIARPRVLKACGVETVTVARYVDYEEEARRMVASYDGKALEQQIAIALREAGEKR